MIKLKFRNTRENRPTVKVDDLDEAGLFETTGVPCSEGNQIMLKLVNVGGITSDVTLTCLDDEATYKADGWNTYLFPLERNNKPFEIGVCAAIEGDEWPEKETATEEDFEEFDEEEDEVEDFDDSDDDELDDIWDEETPAPTPSRAATARTVAVVAAAPIARTAQPAQKKVYETDVSSADILAAYYDHSENKAAAARYLNMSPRTFGRRLEAALAEGRKRGKGSKNKPALGKAAKSKRAATKKSGSKKRR